MSGVIIIGGGIGGLTAAAALRKKGFDAQVYEAAPELRPVGKGIWVPTNAMQVLDRLGLSDAVARAGWPLDRIQVLGDGGDTLLNVDLHRVRAKYGHTTISIHRAALVQALADALPPGTVHLAKRCASFQQDASAVAVRFEDGTEATGELLVGADGIRSIVREQVVPEVPLRYSGQTCYRGIADMELPAELARTCWEVWGGSARIGFSAVGPRQVYWFAPVVAAAGSGERDQASAERLAACYADFPPPIPEIVRLTPVADIIRTDLYDFVPIRRWWQGRVVLIGDAAHAMTPNLGQGGAQAIEDAYVLADKLASCATAAEAFEAYQRLRMPKVQWIVNTAWRFGQMAHVRSRWLQRLRNMAIKWTPTWVNQRQFDQLYGLNY